MAGTLADAYVDIRGKTDNLLRDIDSAASKGGLLGGRTFADKFDRSIVDSNGSGGVLSRFWASLTSRAKDAGDEAGTSFAERLAAKLGTSIGRSENAMNQLWKWFTVQAAGTGDQAGRDLGERFASKLGTATGNAENQVGRFWKWFTVNAGDTGDQGGNRFAERFAAKIGTATGRSESALSRLWNLLKSDGSNAGALTGQAFQDELKKKLSSGGGGSSSSNPLTTFWRIITFDAGRSGRGAAGAFLVGLAAALSPALPGLTLQLLSALAPLTGALGLIPATAIPAAAGIGTLAIAFSGMKDAIGAGLTGDVKKFDDAIKGMGPNALAVVKAIVAMKPAFDDLRKVVQNNFFSGLALDVKQLGQIYLPALRNTLGGTATQFNNMLRSIAALAESPKFVNNIGLALAGVTTIIGNLLKNVPGFAQALVQMAAVGTPILVKLSETFSGIGQKFADFISKVSSNGQLSAFINGAITAFGQLFTVVSKLGGIIEGIVAISGSAGTNLLGTFGTLLTVIDDFIHSASGVQVLSSVFFGLGQITDAVGKALKDLLVALGPLLTVLPGVFAGLVTAVAPVLPLVGQLVNALGVGLLSVISALTPALSSIVQELTGALQPVLPVITELFRTIAPVVGQIAATLAQFLAPALDAVSKILVATLPLFAQVAAALGGVLVQALQELLPVFVQLLPVIADLAVHVLPQLLPSVLALVAALAKWIPVLVPVVIILTNALIPLLRVLIPVITWVVTVLASFIAIVAQILGWIGQFVNWLDILIATFLTAKSTWQAVGNFFLSVGKAIGDFFTGFGAKVNKSFSDGWNQIISAMTGFGQTINNFFDNLGNSINNKVARGIDGVVNFFKGLVPKTLGAVSSLGSSLSGLFQGAMSSAGSAVSGGISTLAGLASSIPGRIVGAIGNLGGILFNAGQSIVQGLINGVESMISSLRSALGAITSLIPNVKGPKEVDLKLLRPSGQWIMQGLMQGINDQIPNLQKQLGGVTSAIPSMAGVGSASALTNTNNTSISLTNNVAGNVDPQQLAKATVARLVFALNTGVAR